MNSHRIRSLAFPGVALSLLSATVAFAAPDRTAETSPFEWDGGPISGGIAGINTGTDNTLVKMPGGGNLTVKLTKFEDQTGEPDFDMELFAADEQGDPTGESLGEALEADSEKETLTVKNLKPGNYVVETRAYLTVNGTFHGALTVTGGSAPAAGGAGGGTTKPAPDPAPVPAPGTGTGTAPQPAADQTPDAKLGKLTKKAFRGTASDDKGVKTVQVAVERKKGKKCTQMTRKGKFVKSKKCGAPTQWLTAKGTAKWSYKLKKKLKKGSYTVLARATDSAGQAQAGFTPANKRTLKVK